MLLSTPAMLMLSLMVMENNKTKQDKMKMIFPEEYENLRESVGKELEGRGYIKDYSLYGQNGFSCTLLKKLS